MDIYNELAVKDLFALAKDGENSGIDFDEDDNWKRRIVHAKMLIDRWGVVSSDIFINSKHRTHCLQNLGVYINTHSDNSVTIYSAELHFEDYIPEDECLIAAFDGDNLVGDIMSRAVASFPVPTK